ncbi:MAG: hypothetical protein GYB31_14420 [Bacteroidetes bacterium]|nr:hypothetical protein [Bacteroidota bacterium]
MKFLIMLLLGYFAYRVFLQPMLNPPKNPSGRNDGRDDDYEYTDYEEVE